MRHFSFYGGNQKGAPPEALFVSEGTQINARSMTFDTAGGRMVQARRLLCLRRLVRRLVLGSLCAHRGRHVGPLAVL